MSDPEITSDSDSGALEATEFSESDGEDNNQEMFDYFAQHRASCREVVRTWMDDDNRELPGLLVDFRRCEEQSCVRRWVYIIQMECAAVWVFMEDVPELGWIFNFPPNTVLVNHDRFCWDVHIREGVVVLDGVCTFTLLNVLTDEEDKVDLRVRLTASGAEQLVDVSC